MKPLLEKMVLFVKERPWSQVFLFGFFELLPNVEFYYSLILGIVDFDVDWNLVRQYFPSILYGAMTGLLFLLYIHAQAGYYEVKENAKETMRLNQLYKERFKMIMKGDADKMFGQIEKKRWARRLYEKEKDKKVVDEFINKQYNFQGLDYPTNEEIEKGGN